MKFCTEQAAQGYRRIAEEGGWPALPAPLRQDDAPDDIKRLRQRLAMDSDLRTEEASHALTGALKDFQRRAGLQQSGEVDKATLKALNVPADVRSRELEASAERIASVSFPFDQPYVVVNIPSASVEAVQDSRVVHRHAAIAGKIDWPAPQLTAEIRSITLNPIWTIPRSIVEHEVIPELRKDP
jgi:murein L,D-transpeptidase YcbB/YkuD